jgi:glycosyltransferase involved in cell wall biosynthesis
MNLTIIGPVYPFRGGIAHYTTMLARALDAYGHRVQVISFRRQYPIWLYPGSSDKDPSKKPLKFKAEYLLDPLFPWTWIRAANYIVKGQPDLVVIQWWTTFWAIPFAILSWQLKRHGIPVIYLIHNVLPHEQRLWDRWLARQALSHGRNFVTQTTDEQERLLSIIPNAHIDTCPHPVYSSFFEHKIPKSEARKRLHLPQDTLVLLFFGIVRPYKGLKHLIDALGLLCERGIKPHLVIAGEFWENKQNYIDQIKKQELSSQVHIVDRYIPNEELEILFSAADLFVAPYTGGSQSGAVEMALGFGLPVVVTDIIAQGISENSRNSCSIVPPGDAMSLAKAIDDFIQNPNLDSIQTHPATDDWERLVKTLLKISS